MTPRNVVLVASWVRLSWLLGGCSTTPPYFDAGTPTPCTSSDACAADKYCSGGSCVPKETAGPCADSAEHTAFSVCQSGLCLAGNCCASTCAATEPLCKATSCDLTTGACRYPDSAVACGPAQSCTNGSLTAASACDGHGGCNFALPMPCASLTCKDATTCLLPCADNSACAPTEYCAWNQCTPKAGPGGVCGMTGTSSANSGCISDVCLGTNCCSAACDMSSAACGANSCDATGACVFAAKDTACGAAQTCVGDTFTPPNGCDGNGHCVAGTPTSCEPAVCNSLPPQSCYASCTADGGQCAADAYCNAQACAFQLDAGQPCAATATSDANSACKSGICLVNCCIVDCPADPTTSNCKGNCDNVGVCQPHGCANNFGCSGTNTCNTSCTTNAECAGTAFCDPIGVSACCAQFQTGDTLYVDGVNGADNTPCCGAKGTPCQTIKRALALVGVSGNPGVTLALSNSDGSNGWNPPNETWPIHLGYGVTLSAPGIYFSNPNNPSDTFDIYAFDATDTAAVTIQGGAKDVSSDAVFVGFNPLDPKTAYYNSYIGVNDGVAGKTALPLVLSEVWINASSLDTRTNIGLNIGAGGQVTLGPNPVVIGTGNDIYPYNNSWGWTGVFCKGTGASLSDDPNATARVLTIDNQNTFDMDIEDDCTVSLTQGPALGITTGTIQCSPNQCAWVCPIASSSGIKAVGSANITFGGSPTIAGSISCHYSYGVDMETSNASGSPTVLLQNTTVSLTQCAAVYVNEGSFSATGSTFTTSYVGVWATGNAVSVDLSGGSNTLSCNAGTDPGTGNPIYHYSYDCPATSPYPPTTGATDLLNSTAGIGINAENVTWDHWDTTNGTTQQWVCTDNTYSDCTCTGPNCTADTIPPDDADAISLSTNTAALPIDSTQGTQSPNACP